MYFLKVSTTVYGINTELGCLCVCMCDKVRKLHTVHLQENIFNNMSFILYLEKPKDTK